MSGTLEYCGLIRPSATMTVVIIVIIVWFRSIFPSCCLVGWQKIEIGRWRERNSLNPRWLKLDRVVSDSRRSTASTERYYLFGLLCVCVCAQHAPDDWNWREAQIQTAQIIIISRSRKIGDPENLEGNKKKTLLVNIAGIALMLHNGWDIAP